MGEREDLVAQAFVERYLVREKFPLSLDHIAYAIEKKLDVEIHLHRRPLPDGLIARLMVAQEIALIYVNSLLPVSVQRFGVAHEFGHVLLDHRGGIQQPGVGESEREKQEADSFAAALLMPTWIVSDFVRKYSDSLVFLVNKLAKYCDVSLEAAARRLAETDIIPGLWVMVDPSLGRIDWEYHASSIRLDRETFREFLVSYFSNPRKVDGNIEVMGYPFRIETKRMWGKYLLSCMPLKIATMYDKTPAWCGVRGSL
ncbi:MAG: ImmA/IrrE family metallo-endopeptidase [Desulfosporosinus sp.]|nr:ImmA/IrrE family metallo-endopeptidase [Desulfosporosinus sp.]